MKKNIIIAVIVVIAAVGSFFGGMKYEQSKTLSNVPSGARAFNNLTAEQRQQMVRNGNGVPVGGIVNGGGGFTVGEIISKDSESITLKLVDGGSKIVFFSDSTEISKNATGTPADLVSGDSVTVTGTANQDGSLTATSIQLRALPAIPSGSPAPASN